MHVDHVYKEWNTAQERMEESFWCSKYQKLEVGGVLTWGHPKKQGKGERRYLEE